MEKDFTGLRLGSFGAHASRFDRCVFAGMRVETATFGSGVAVSEYVDCVFDGARIQRAMAGFARFVRCSFRDVDLREWDGEFVDMVDCVVSGTVRSGQFWGAPLPQSGESRYRSYARGLTEQGLGEPPESVRALMLRTANEFHDNDFSGAELVKTSFRGGADLTRQRLPQGPDYLYVPDAAAAIDAAVARLDAGTVPDDLVGADLQPRVRRFLTGVLGRDVEQGQRQLLVRAKDFASRGAVKPHAAAAVALLADVIKES
ncbi:hypothetical protein ACPCHT_27535 [Nucisporomicrobium flavum]|uniref:hypothetical protein n=1 Tax=Nucisporomicrobium flavum TaxID=2785915 RepID=UPI003C2CA1A0